MQLGQPAPSGLIAERHGPWRSRSEGGRGGHVASRRAERGARSLSLAQAAAQIGVDAATLRAWSREGLLVLVPRGRTPHVPLVEVVRVRRTLGFTD